MKNKDEDFKKFVVGRYEAGINMVSEVLDEMEKGDGITAGQSDVEKAATFVLVFNKYKIKGTCNFSTLPGRDEMKGQLRDYISSKISVPA